MPIVLALICFLVLEITAIIEVGAWLGTSTCLLLLFGTSFLGLALLQREGLAVFRQLSGWAQRSQGDAMPQPPPPIARSLPRFVAGLCLLCPGFITDTAALFVCLPPLSTWITRWGRGLVARNARLHQGNLHADFESDPGRGTGVEPNDPVVIDLPPPDWRVQ